MHINYNGNTFANKCLVAQQSSSASTDQVTGSPISLHISEILYYVGKISFCLHQFPRNWLFWNGSGIFFANVANIATETLHHKAWDDIPSCAPINNADCTVWTLEMAQLDREEHCWPLPQPNFYNQIQWYSFYLFTHVFYLINACTNIMQPPVNDASMLTLVIKHPFVCLTSMSEVTKAVLWPFTPTLSGPSIPSCWSVQSVTEPTCNCSPPYDRLECNCKSSVLVNTALKWMVFSELFIIFYC